MKRPLKIALLVLGALLLCATIGAAVFYARIQDPGALFAAPTPLPAVTAVPTAAPAPTAALTAALAPTAQPTPTPAPTPDPDAALSQAADMDFMKDRVNILALGIDESAERSAWGSYRTDTMILITADFAHNTAALLSIPRDCYVKIYNSKGELARPEAPFEKINNAFVRGGGAQKNGYAYACTTVSKLLDVPVQHYICVNIPVVKQIVDAMGGIDYEMDVDFTMNGRSYTQGLQHMNGQAVMDYCRLRKGSSDLARADRQQRILFAILQSLRDSGAIRNVPAIYEAVQANVATDLSVEQIAALALFAYRMDMQALTRHTVDVTGMTLGGKSCLGVDTQRLEKLVKEVFGRKSVNIDPEIDATALQSALPAMAQPGAQQVLNWYASGGVYYVQTQPDGPYNAMSQEEFDRLTQP